MTQRIQTGTLFIADGTVIPKAVVFDSRPYLSGWTEIGTFASGQLGKNLNTAGWTFFYMAGKFAATVFGFDKNRLEKKAMARLITVAKSEDCNCLQVAESASKSWLGIHAFTLCAHARHIQQSSLFLPLNQR